MNSKIIRLILIVFFLSLGARVLYVETVKDTLIFKNQIVDSETYNKAAIRLSQDKAGGSDTLSYRIPFYQNFLAGIYHFTWPDARIAALVQSVIGAISVCVAAYVACVVFGLTAAWISGIMGALYWPLIAFCAKTLPINLAIFFCMLVLLFLTRFFVRRNAVWPLLSGAALAYGALCQANLLLIFPVVVLLFASDVFRRKLTVRILYLVLFAAGFLSIIMPRVISDFEKRHEIMPIQDNLGVCLYTGSDLDLIAIQPGSAYSREMRVMLELELLSVNDRNRYWIKKTVDKAKADPVRFVKSFFTKVYLLVNAYEFSPRESLNHFRSLSWFLSLPLFNAGLVSSLGILGMILAFRLPRERTRALYILIFTVFVSLLPFSPLSRFRVLLSLFMIIFAGFGLSSAWEYVRQKDAKALFVWFPLAIPLLALTMTCPIKGYLDSFSRPFYYEGLLMDKAGDHNGAINAFKTAIGHNRNDPDVYYALGNIYMRKQDYPRAGLSYQKAIRLEPRFPEAQEKLGIVYAQQGMLKKAEDMFKEVLSSYPTETASTHINLGNCYALEGDLAAAEREYGRAIGLAPDNTQALYLLGSLYDRTKDPRAGDIWKRYSALTKK